jgi:hypothetical protein
VAEIEAMPTEAQKALASDICFTLTPFNLQEDRDVVARMIAEYLRREGRGQA